MYLFGLCGGVGCLYCGAAGGKQRCLAACVRNAVSGDGSKEYPSPGSPMKRIGNRIHNRLRRSGRSLPSETSKLEVFPHFVAHSGIPEAADSLAYEPIQRLLAVGTKDGRLKIVGSSGVEKLLLSDKPGCTRQLLFLTNRGTVVRLEEGGSMEVWGVDSGEMVCRVEVPGDRICCVSQVPGEPYLMLGCAHGDMRVACLTDVNGEPTTEAREVKGTMLMKYFVRVGKIGGRGELVHCSVSGSRARSLVIALHSISGAVVWNMRRQTAILRVNPDSDGRIKSYGGVSACCWVGNLHEPLYFATAHQSGDIVVWKLPENLDQEQTRGPEMICRCRVVPEGTQASRISAISHVSGETWALLVEGGQSIEEPDTLTKIPIPLEASKGSSTDDVQYIQATNSLPWFGVVNGYALIPPNGSLVEYDDPVAVMVLTEGGQLMLHDFIVQNPIPFSLPFQSITIQSVSEFVTLGRDTPLRVETDPRHGYEEFGGMEDPLHKWILSGGEASCPSETSNASFYFSGHVDGAVRVWNMSCEAPKWLDTIPHPGTSEVLGQSMGVSTIGVSGCGELLAVGHREGHVQLYRFSSNCMDSEVRTVTGANVEVKKRLITETSGYQLILSIRVHSTDISTLNFNRNSTQIAVGDVAGNLSVVDISNPTVVFHRKVSPSAIKSAWFGPFDDGKSFSEDGVLYLTSGQSCSAVFDASTGDNMCPNEEWVRPKHGGETLLAHLLDATGLPLRLHNIPTGEIPWLPASNWPKSAHGEESHAVEPVWTTNTTPEVDQNRSTPRSPSEKPDTEVFEAEDCNSEDVQSSCSAEMLAAAVAQMEEATEDAPELDGHEKKGRILGKLQVPKWVQGRKKEKSNSGKDAQSSIESGSPGKHPGGIGEHKTAGDKFGSERDSPTGDVDSPTSRNASGVISSMFLLLVNTDSARIYPTDGIVHGDRHSIQKVYFASKIVFAAPIQDSNTFAAGIAAVSEDFRIRIYSLPSLETLEDVDLGEIMGYDIANGLDDDAERSIDHYSFATDGQGQLVVRGMLGEMARIGLVDGCAAVNKPLSVYDWELATAAHSARNAALHRSHQSGKESHSEHEGLGGTIRKGFGSVLEAARKARDELDKAMHLPSTKEPVGVSPPELQKLFHSEEQASILSDPMKSATTKVEPQSARVNAQSVPAHKPTEHRNMTAREELFAGARNPPGEQPRMRTADEIREAYGRPREQNAGAGRVAGLMAENVQKLNERGERLKGLDDKTADLSNEAANFASLAKQLAEQQKNKKWWQL